MGSRIVVSVLAFVGFSLSAFAGAEDEAPFLRDFGAQRNVPVKLQMVTARANHKSDLLFRVMEAASLEVAYVRFLRDVPKDFDLETEAFTHEYKALTDILDLAIIRRFVLDMSWDAEGSVTQVTMRVPSFKETHEEIDPTKLRAENLPEQMHVSAIRWKKGLGVEYFLSSTAWIPTPPAIQQQELATQRAMQDAGITFGKIVPPSEGRLKFTIPFSAKTEPLATFRFSSDKEGVLLFTDSLTALQQQTPVSFVASAPIPQFYTGHCPREILHKGIMGGWGPGGGIP